MKVQQVQINFLGKPQNYASIDKYLSRSAQPQKEDFEWLKEQGVTDVFNFRTRSAELDFDEKNEVEKLGMKYHNIPSITREPTEANVNRFLSEVGSVISKNGKAHIHCKAGADRTGMYAYIYKSVKNIGTKVQNQLEMILMGHYFIKYPNLMSWANNYVNKIKHV